MDISLRTKQLNSLFSYDKKTELEESHLEEKWQRCIHLPGKRMSAESN